MTTLRRWQQAWANLPTAACRLAGCDRPAAAVFEAWGGGAWTLYPICAVHAPLAAEAGYPVTWPPQPGTPVDAGVPA
jgi:hypothetical protein